MSNDLAAIAYHRLSGNLENPSIDKGIVEFMSDLCEIERELLEFETEIANIELGKTGYSATSALAKFDSRHNLFVEEIEIAYHAIILGQANRLDRYSANDHTRQTNN
ncbi:hypothetical protein ACFQL9_13420 [Halobaculum lipolyticum]|uniref:Uncharacterized protein n=1 Tax=Halobaculum lipolyticum TaxID=3032001 RepID=A0ABD5WCC8_9EURY